MRLILLSLASVALLAVESAGVSAAPRQAGRVAAKTVVDAPRAKPRTLAAASGASTAPAQAAQAFAGESDEAVSGRVLAYLDGLSTLQGGFTQIAPDGGTTEGVFYLKRPGLLRFDYAPPSPLKIVANGGLVYVRDDKLETTDSYPLGETPLKFLLRKRMELKDIRIAAVERKPGAVAVTFASTDPKTEGELVAVFDAPSLALRQWAIHDARGGVTIVTLRDVVAGKDIPNRTFATPETKSPFLNNR